MDVLIKAATATLPVVQILWARFVIQFAIVSLALPLAGKRLPPVSRRPRLQAVRSLTLALCNLCFTAAIAFIPLAEATAINFLAPLLVLVLAGWWLRETIGWRRWTAVGAGLLGVVIILRPGMGVTHPAAFLVLGTALLFSVYSVMTRLLARYDDSLTTIWHTGLAASIATSLVVPFFWVTPGPWGIAALLAIGVLGAIGHYLLILAYAAAPASLLAPFSYTQLVWAALFGWLVFADIPDLPTLLGGLVIAAGGLLSIAEGGRLAQAQRAVPAAAERQG
ncbi:MAG: DMT family transporter [Acetobacteraceae bacterium]|nr:DMT family transporter [Acetobacteraceae bacterium]